MSFSNKSIRLGSAITILFFISSFAKTIILTPLMLTHWGKDVFCFWALLLSVRALLCFLPDSFIRYIANSYNLHFHKDPRQAQHTMRVGLSFLIVFSVLLCSLVALLFCGFGAVAGFVFDTPISNAANFALATSTALYILAACVQNVQRMYGAVKEPVGLIWQNLLMETMLLLTEIVMLALLIAQDFSFGLCVAADSILIMVAAVVYLLHLRFRYPLPGSWSKASLKAGTIMFGKAGKLYASNFFEKLSSDGLVLLLSFFKYDKAIIALFSTIRTIVNTPLLANNLLLNTYTPELQKKYSLSDSKGLQQLLQFIRLGLGSVLLIGIVCCYPLYQPLFLYWTKHQLDYNNQFMDLMLLLTVLNLFGLSYHFILKGINAMNKMLLLMLLKSAIIIVGFSMVSRSVVPVAWVLLIAEVITSLIALPLLVQHQLSADSLHVPLKENLSTIIPYLLSIAVLIRFSLAGFSTIVVLIYLLFMALALYPKLGKYWVKR
jgi:hypothetical protein